MSEGTSSTIIKRGEQYGVFTLHRSPAGLTMAIYVHPVVEEFIRGLSATPEVATVDAKTLGRYWRSKDDTKPLLVYRTEKLPPQEYEEDGVRFTIDKPGDQLLLEAQNSLTGRNEAIVNLSFLRLQGISEEKGVEFGVRGVYSYESLKEMDRRLTAGIRKFYTRYLKPIDLSIQVHTQEMSL